jgi:hypothetical protein
MPDYDAFFKGFTKPPKGCIVIDPFAEDESTSKWLDKKNILIAYSSKESHPLGLRIDALKDPPKYAGTYVVTTPPWTKKYETADNTLFDRYGSDNLYKCFIRTLLKMKSPAQGGSILVPLTFLVGVRDSEKKRRQDFFTLYKPLRINIFQTPWRNNLSVAINFVARNSTKEEFWPTYFYPSNSESLLIPTDNYKCLSGQDPYETGYRTKPAKRITIWSGTPRKDTDTLLNIRVRTHDTVTQRAGLTEDTLCYPLVIRGFLSKKAQLRLIRDFNEWLNNWRNQTNSLFMSFTAEGRHFISLDFAIEAMTRIIWSYYISKPSQSPHKIH